MVGRTVSHYQIMEQIGSGGMGVVYRAQDTRLMRTVALKFLRADSLGDNEQRTRFLRKAQAAAALDHANVCTVYEIDTVDDQVFIAMALAKGESLKARISRGPLDPEAAIAIAVQVARALKAAHDLGIIHRDVTPGNVMVDENGQVKVMDFGLAKMNEGPHQAITTGIVGTPAYMSPEQVSGESLDYRTDIWSWGVVLYEMLAGKLPFSESRVAALVYAIVNKEAVALNDLDPDVPAYLERIVERALAKRPENRFANFDEVLVQLEQPSMQTTLLESTRRLAGTNRKPSIAVLAFADMSAEQDQEYFCDGIADEIINDLNQIDGLQVASRTSSFAYKDAKLDVREIGRQLAVETVLEGSVRKAGQRLRISSRLVGVKDGYQLWADSYNRELQDVFAIQDEIAHSIVQALRVELSDVERRVLDKTPTRDVEAYDYYLRGKQYFHGSRRKSMDYALDMFRRAVEKDPNYALAYAGIANCYCYLYMHFGGEQTDLQQADEAAQQALKLDSELAEAHAARGFCLSLEKQQEAAETAFEKAIKLNSSLWEAFYFYARMCYSAGQYEKAARMFERACRADPDDYQATSLLGMTYRTIGLDDEAREVYRKTVNNVERHIELNPDDSRAIYLGAQALIELGRQEEGWRWACRAIEIDPDDSSIVYGMACICCRVGKPDEALDHLENAVTLGFHHREWIENDTDLSDLRALPRFEEVLSRLGATTEGTEDTE